MNPLNDKTDKVVEVITRYERGKEDTYSFDGGKTFEPKIDETILILESHRMQPTSDKTELNICSTCGHDEAIHVGLGGCNEPCDEGYCSCPRFTATRKTDDSLEYIIKSSACTQVAFDKYSLRDYPIMIERLEALIQAERIKAQREALEAVLKFALRKQANGYYVPIENGMKPWLENKLAELDTPRKDL